LAQGAIGVPSDALLAKEGIDGTVRLAIMVAARQGKIRSERGFFHIAHRTGRTSATSPSKESAMNASVM
jgi:hypothetical protein